MARFTVLVADDSPAFRRALVLTLEGHDDFEVVGEAQDGPSAIEAIRERRPDIALVDVEMPGCTGSQVVSRLKRERLPTSFVLVSGIEERELALASAHAGADSFVDKSRGPTFVVAQALQIAERWEGVR